ncbi:TIMELESS-interacting protein [Sarotherodon galilaeus]
MAGVGTDKLQLLNCGRRGREMQTRERQRKRETERVKGMPMLGHTIQVSPIPVFVKAGKAPKESSSRSRREEQPLPKRKPVVIPYVSGVSEQLRCIFSKHRVSVAFKPQNTLRQKLVHPKDRVPRHKQSNMVYAVKCQEDCQDLYIGETKQPLMKRMAQHRRATSSGQDCNSKEQTADDPKLKARLSNFTAAHTPILEDLAHVDREGRVLRRMQPMNLDTLIESFMQLALVQMVAELVAMHQEQVSTSGEATGAGNILIKSDSKTAQIVARVQVIQVIVVKRICKEKRLDFYKLLEDVSPLIQEASSVLREALQDGTETSHDLGFGDDGTVQKTGD